MYNGLKVIVVMPAYNAEKTLDRTVSEIPTHIVDEIILCDDASADATFAEAKRLGIDHVIRHETNLGYGGNQKSLYHAALESDGDIIIMLHPDYQYTPKLIPAMVNLIGEDLYDVVLGSRILGNGALKGGHHARGRSNRTDGQRTSDRWRIRILRRRLEHTEILEEWFRRSSGRLRPRSPRVAQSVLGHRTNDLAAGC